MQEKARTTEEDLEEEEAEKIGLKKEDTLRRDKWRDRVRAIAEGMGYIRSSLLKGQHWIKTKSLHTPSNE